MLDSDYHRFVILQCIISTSTKITGPYMGFAGAAWNVRPVVEVLSPLLPFNFPESHTLLQRMAARHVGAFRKAFVSLEGHYRSDSYVDGSLLQPLCHRQIFPYQTWFTSLADSTTQHFEYASQPTESKPLFFGKLSDDRDVCIKFTSHYSPEAHSFCASIGAAPELLGFEKLAGGWCMVVMDRIGDYIEFHQSPTVPDIFDELHDALSQLHKAGFVHGDIRDTNIMVHGSGEQRFLLVDFDWAGKIGEVEYPPNVYHGKDLWRPDGALDGELIMAVHDIQMLHHLFAL
jgi:hypothetical protein